MSEIESRRALIDALEDAAEVEHLATCQYLFAAASLKQTADEGCSPAQCEMIREWHASLLLVAREEMEHLGLVSNLLTAVGGTPHFGRPQFPATRSDGNATIEFTLEPFSVAVMQRFLALERSHEMPEPASAAGFSVGALYRRIGRGLEALDDAQLWVGPASAQVSNRTIDLPSGWYDIDLFPIDDLTSARAAVERILESSGENTEVRPSHAERFERVLSQLEQQVTAEPRFRPARPVVSNPSASRLLHPVTRRAAELFDTAYDVMLRMLMRFYSPTDETAAELEGLRSIVFFPLMTMIMRPLAEILTRMPASTGSPEPTAGPPFGLGSQVRFEPYKQSAWVVLQEILDGMAADCLELKRRIANETDGWARAIEPRLAFVATSFDSIAINFSRSMDLDTIRSLAQLKQLMKKRD